MPKTHANDDKLIFLPDLAKVLGVAERTVWGWKKSGKLITAGIPPYVHPVNNRICFRRSDVELALNNLEVANGCNTHEDRPVAGTIGDA